MWTCLKANRIFLGSLHTLPKPPPSVDGGDWLTSGSNPQAIQGQANEQH